MISILTINTPMIFSVWDVSIVQKYLYCHIVIYADFGNSFYTNRWQECPQGARRQRNFRSKAWFRSRGCSKNHVFDSLGTRRPAGAFFALAGKDTKKETPQGSLFACMDGYPLLCATSCTPGANRSQRVPRNRRAKQIVRQTQSPTIAIQIPIAPRPNTTAST